MMSYTHTAHTCRSPFTGAFVRYERLSRPRSVPRLSQRQRRNRYRICACASRHARKDRAAKRPEPLRWRQERSTRRWKDHVMQARLTDVDLLRRSPLSLFGMTERRSPEHHSGRTTDCQRADTLATLATVTKLLQPPFASKPAECWNRRPS